MDNQTVIAAFFDIDGTLTREHTWAGYMDYFRHHKLKSGTHFLFQITHYPLYFLRKLGLISEDSFRRPWAAHLAWYVKGMSIAQARPIWDWTVRFLENSWHPDTLQVLKNHQQNGDLVMLVSSGPLPMVEQFAARIGVEHFIGTAFEIRGGHYTGQSLTPIVISAMKASAARSYLQSHQIDIDLDGSFAYADSTTDLPLLEMVGNPVAAHPDADLRSIAEQRGWKILE